MSAVEVAFVVTAVVTAFASLRAVSVGHAIHAVLWLAVALVGVAGCFLLLGAELLAWVQVLVYVGAVVVLVVFAAMATPDPTGTGSAATTGNRPLALVAGAGSAAGLACTVVAGFGGARLRTSGVTGAHQVGTAVFGPWAVAFEALGVVLLAALVAAVTLARTPVEH